MEIEYEKELRVKMTSHIYLIVLWSITLVQGQIWPKKKLRDQIGLFESWGANLTLEAKLKDQSGYFDWLELQVRL